MAPALIAPLAMAHQWRTAAALPPAAPLASRAQRHNVTFRALARRHDSAHLSRMVALAPLTIDHKPARTRKISKRVRHAIDAMIDGRAKTQKAAAELAGLTRERLCRALKESHVQQYLGQQTRVMLAQSQAPAAATILALMDNAKSEHVRKDCATTILGMNGLRSEGDRGPLVSVSFGDAPGYIVDFSGGDPDAIRQIGPAGGVIMPRNSQPPANGILDNSRLIDVTPNAAERTE